LACLTVLTLFLNLQMLGTFLLWFGWYGFNGGNAILFEYNQERSSQAALTAVNSTLAAGSGGITCLILNYIYLERTLGEGYFDVARLRNGALSGLVAITSGCAIVEPWAAWVIGMTAGVAYLLSNRLLLWFRIDDAVDAIPVHLTNGIVSLIMTGLLASPRRLLDTYGRSTHVGLFYSWGQGNFDFVLLGTQVIGIIFIAGWVMFFMLPFFTLLDFLGMFRSDPLEEIVGLDTSYHGGLALMNSMHIDESNNDSFSEHMNEYKRRREEAKRTRLRILQKLKDEDHDTDDIADGRICMDTPGMENTRSSRSPLYIDDKASGDEMSRSEISEINFKEVGEKDSASL
jgi:Ammonium Transporter Family